MRILCTKVLLHKEHMAEEELRIPKLGRQVQSNLFNKRNPDNHSIGISRFIPQWVGTQSEKSRFCYDFNSTGIKQKSSILEINQKMEQNRNWTCKRKFVRRCFTRKESSKTSLQWRLFIKGALLRKFPNATKMQLILRQINRELCKTLFVYVLS